jgi:hypothetical protein
MILFVPSPQELIYALFWTRSAGFFGAQTSFRGSYFLELLYRSVSSQSASPLDPIVFVEVGRFTRDGIDHKNYVQ